MTQTYHLRTIFNLSVFYFSVLDSGCAISYFGEMASIVTFYSMQSGKNGFLYSKVKVDRVLGRCDSVGYSGVQRPKFWASAEKLERGANEGSWRVVNKADVQDFKNVLALDEDEARNYFRHYTQVV